MGRIVKDPKQRRKEILDASRQLFLTKGYESTTLQDVMTTLNIAKGTTYHYFKSKGDLLEAVVQEMAEEFVTQVKDSIAHVKGPVLQRFQVLMESSRAKGSLAESIDSLHRPDNIGLHTRLLAVTVLKLAPLYAEIIEQGCREKIFNTEHPLECAEFILAGFQFLTDSGCYPWTKQETDRRSNAMPQLIAALLRA